MFYWRRNSLILLLLFGAVSILTGTLTVAAQTLRKGGAVVIRLDVSLDRGWRTAVSEKDSTAFRGFEAPGYQDKSWRLVDVPHNWDAYGGYRRLRHGNLHGYAWYRRNFRIDRIEKDKRYFLWFEGVGSYATVWVNGVRVGGHAGGRTSFTLDITGALKRGCFNNTLAVRADHPANIRDLPWVCGACSDERGFSEGSQPMGIFRPVHLVTTSSTRIEPFGVHIWNDTTVSEQAASLYLETEIKNYSGGRGEKSGRAVGYEIMEKEMLNRNGQGEVISIVNRLVDKTGRIVGVIRSVKVLRAGQTMIVKQELPSIVRPHLWSTDHPYLYTLVTELAAKDQIIDRVTTAYGIRRIHWPDTSGKGSRTFLLNGKAVFINGIAEYEHRLGQSHAFSSAEIRARVEQIKAAGFNAFRDAHQPHNLLYQEYWDQLGLLWWPQLSAHIWYDSPEFRKNFKILLTDWVKERRNSPSLVLWGLQNESKLPADFAKECTALIRQLDPTASSQRMITTCNGGSGTDWDVPQNWTGTYGGDPATYSEDLRKQVLVGEYGAWRTLDDGRSDRMSQLMETKIRLAERVKDQVAGHFSWLFSSHDNPGRVQSGEGWREMDRIGPVNYKGLLSSWEEPLDVFYMYRSNYVSALTSPMVYIVSHTWPDRWTSPGNKSGIIVYSNCEEVELFNDVHALSLGKRRRGGIGTHFQWDSVDIRYNVLYAVGYVKGKEVARDCITLHHLPQAPHYPLFSQKSSGHSAGSGRSSITAAQPGYHYLYRVNCGGPDYKDVQGNTWMADRHLVNPEEYRRGPAGQLSGSKQQPESVAGQLTWGSRSWTDDYPGLPPFFASQRRTADPITGTADAPLFQDFRYGLDRLVYSFPVQDGDYLLELYFAEPWLGIGGGMDCTGWRLFDVAVNGNTVIKDLDIWKEAGPDRAFKKMIPVKVSGGRLAISFPHVAAGQAILSAIAVATKDGRIKPAPPSEGLISELVVRDPAKPETWSLQSWLDTGQPQYTGDKISFSSLPPKLYGAEWIRGPRSGEPASDTIASFRVSRESDIFIALDVRIREKPDWLKDYENTNTQIENDGGHAFQVYRRRYPAGTVVSLRKNGTLPGDEVGTMYTVIVCPATSLEPAYDSKPVTTYKAANARMAGDTVEWDMAVGVADTYSLTVKYRYLSTDTGAGKLEIRMENGTLIKTEPVIFLTTPATKWNYLNSSTGTMINAGHYTVRLIAPRPEGYRVDELQVQ
jgi:beta-galactosidase